MQKEKAVLYLSDVDLDLGTKELCRLIGDYEDGTCVVGDRRYRLPEVRWREFNVVLSADVFLREAVPSSEVVKRLGAEWVYNITARTYVVRGDRFKVYVYVVSDVLQVRVHSHSFVPSGSDGQHGFPIWIHGNRKRPATPPPKRSPREPTQQRKPRNHHTNPTTGARKPHGRHHRPAGARRLPGISVPCV